MEINAYDLVELLKGEIPDSRIRKEHTRFNYSSRTYDIFAVLRWGNYEDVILEWTGDQEFFIRHSNANEMYAGCTISVDEILDILLKGA